MFFRQEVLSERLWDYVMRRVGDHCSRYRLAWLT